MKVARKATWGHVGVAAVLALMMACGSSGGPGPNPTPNPTPTPTPTPPPAGGTTVTITANGVSPTTLTVPPGTQVTFINNDNKNHTMNSDPHPEHTDCPAFDQVGFLVPGQSKQTGNLNIARTCGYHDHELFLETKWQGRIVIQ